MRRKENSDKSPRTCGTPRKFEHLFEPREVLEQVLQAWRMRSYELQPDPRISTGLIPQEVSAAMQVESLERVLKKEAA